MGEQDIHANADANAARCENCGKALLGEYCYACGQPVKGLVRHFSSVAGDFADTVLNYDSRLPRTLWPLFAKPAYLSLEYFAGRRVRYVSPVRLFVTLSIVTFFIAQLMVSFGDSINFNDDDNGFRKAATVEEVIKTRDDALKDLADARKEIGTSVPGAGGGLAAAEAQIRAKADKRIKQLQHKSKTSTTATDDKPAVGDTAPPTATPPSDSDDDDDYNMFPVNGKQWNAKSNPLVVAWLPDFANDWLNVIAGRAEKNIKRMRKDPDQFKDAVLGAVPSTLFVLLPVFALMLKILYAFKRRLYMEHLIVALHSHAFLCIALLLMFLTMALRDWLAPQPGFFNGMFGWIEALLWIWMPLYLLLMQKRVYGQGWPMTLLKFSVLGWCYVILLSIGSVFTVMLSVVMG